MRILLIEDDALIGNGLQIGLTKSGFLVDWFQDGKTGLEAVKSAPYDAVVLDLTLPKMDGLFIRIDDESEICVSLSPKTVFCIY